MYVFLYILYFIIIYTCNVFASGDDKFYSNKLNHCTITHAAINNYEPKNFNPMNNLLRNIGGREVICGTKVIIRGRLLDENCVPISDAKIYLWQVGCDGKYPYAPLRNRIDQNMLNLTNGSSFIGSGIATSNNRGEFTFITIQPPSTKTEKAHLNFRVEHYVIGKLQTKFYPLITNAESNDQANIIYDVEIVMPGHTTKKY